VLDKDENRIMGTFLTIPDYRMKTPEKALVEFAERPAGSPPAIKSWFYPGENYGNEFVYPKTRAVALARTSHQAVPAMPSELAANTTQASNDPNDEKVQEMKHADLKAEEPSGAEVEVAMAFLMVPRAAAPARSAVPDQLPETASQLPLLGCIGLFSLAAGILLRKGDRKLG
jgi:hypothetical protein